MAAPNTSSSTTRTKQWYPGLDGIRGLTFLSIFFVHQKPPGPIQLNGGYASVDLFFVLSGFLITTVLLEEFGRTGTISIRNFYLRRIVRLTPALFAFCAAVFLLTFVDPDLKPVGTSIRLHALGALTYMYNWIGIHTTSTGRDLRFMGPMWTLSVEEQFYAVWPLVALFVLRRSSRRRNREDDNPRSSLATLNPRMMITVLLVGIFVSNVLRVYFGVFGEAKDYNRALWGTDVNASALLIGCLGAVIRVQTPALMQRIRGWLPVLTPVAGVAMAVMLLQMPPAPSKFPFGGALFVFHVLAITLIVGVVERSSGVLNQIFEVRPLRWVGKVSYAAYIVHFFFVLRIGPEIRIPWVINLVITLIVAGLSFRFLEQPLTRHFRARWKLDTGREAPADDTPAPRDRVETERRELSESR